MHLVSPLASFDANASAHNVFSFFFWANLNLARDLSIHEVMNNSWTRLVMSTPEKICFTRLFVWFDKVIIITRNWETGHFCRSGVQTLSAFDWQCIKCSYTSLKQWILLWLSQLTLEQLTISSGNSVSPNKLQLCLWLFKYLFLANPTLFYETFSSSTKPFGYFFLASILIRIGTGKRSEAYVTEPILSQWTPLTHWGRDKMVAIFQTAFSNAFLEWKCINFD